MSRILTTDGGKLFHRLTTLSYLRVYYCTAVCKVYNYVLLLSGIHYNRKSLHILNRLNEDKNLIAPHDCRCQAALQTRDKTEIVDNFAPFCRLANSTKHNVVFDFGPLAPLCENLATTTKPEIDDVLHYR